MINLTPRKIASILTFVGVISLILLLVITCAHAGFTSGAAANPGSLVADYFSATIVIAVIAVLLIAGGIIYLNVTKAKADEKKDIRSQVEQFIQNSNLSAMNTAKKQRAFDILKSRDAIDLLASFVTSACVVFSLDYILFIAKYSRDNIASDIFGTFITALLINLVMVAVLVFRQQASDDYSAQALALLKAAIKTGVSEEDDSDIITMKDRDFAKLTASQKVFKVLGTILNYAFLLVIALIVLFPFYWMIISSLKSLTEYRANIPTLFPEKIVFENYLIAFKQGNLATSFMNTVYVGVVSTLLSLVITVLSAFAFARLEFKGRETLFAILLGTMMIPGELFTITNYATVHKFGWINNGFTVLIVPFLVSIFYIYLLRQNFLQIPNELYLAAKVDGTTDLKYLWKVMIPLALPTLISITILKMMGSWNSYMWPNLVANKEHLMLVTNGIRKADFSVGTMGGEGAAADVNYPIQMAAVAMVSAPLFLVFLFLRKYIMKGVSRSGIKG
jgi:multiple sugar transport system permease protein